VTAEPRSAVPFDEARDELREDAASEERVLEDVDFFVALDRDADVDPVERDEAGRDLPPELPCPLAAAIPLPKTARSRARRLLPL
jgi:hypothetical protein